MTKVTEKRTAAKVAAVAVAAAAATAAVVDTTPSFLSASDTDSEGQYGMGGRDFDPEDADFGSTFDSRGGQSKRVRYQTSSSSSSSQLDGSRQHYHNLPGRSGPGDGRPSRLRSKVPLPIDDETFMDGKYAGRKVSRADLGFAGETSKDDDDEVEVEEEEQEEEEEEKSSWPLSASKTGEASSKDKKSDPSLEDNDRELREQLAALQAAQERQLEMVATKAVEDAVRGAAVREQLAKWQAVLDVRIHLQPLLTASHRLPLKRVIYETSMVDRDLQERVLSQLQDLCQRLAEGWDSSLPCSPSLGEAWESRLSEWDARMSPKWRESLDQWHHKVSLNGPDALSAKRQMKVINQSLWNQMETALRDHDRLLKRAFTRRSDVIPIGEEPEKDDEIKIRFSPILGQDATSAHFDDGDFFSLLVRDWIASGASATGLSGTVDAAKAAGLTISRVRVHRSGVDPRASKGRKLRYDVQERLVNYMVPVRDVTTQWSDDKIDALYASTFHQPEGV